MIVNPVYPYHRADAPASFLHTSLVDMCHWCITCLSLESGSSHSILSPDGFRLMWTPVAPRGYPPLYESAGLGWVLGHVNGVQTVSHGGAGFGSTGFLTLMPEKGRAAIILCNEESSAHNHVTDVVIDVLLDRDPVAGPVSWMVPVCHALQSGGIDAAYACYPEVKNNPEYFLDNDELISLVYQLIGVKKIDLAIDVLKFNLFVFPSHIGSLYLLAKLYLQKKDYTQAETVLKEALSIAPHSFYLSALYAEVLIAKT
jgi:hypothetical protein